MSTEWRTGRVLAVLLTVSLGGVFGVHRAAFGESGNALTAQVGSQFDDYDPTLVAELVAEGFSEDEALFIALTDVEVKDVRDDHVRITDTFPTGNEAVVDIRIVQKDTGGPDVLTVKTTPAGQDFKFSLKYSAAIPVDAQPSFALGDGATGSVASLVSLGVPAQGAGPSNLQVIVTGLVKKFVGSKASDFVKYLDKKFETGTKVGAVAQTLKSGASVVDALKLKSDFDALMAELDALEKCAKNPTNPLTKKEYKNNPSERDRVLKEIEGVRAELRGNTAAMFIGTVNKEGAGLIKSAKWLGYVIGPGTAWALQNFRDVAQDRMNEIRKGVVPCTRDYKIEKASPDGYALKGTKCESLDGEWVLRGVLDSSGVHSEVVYTITIGKGSHEGTYQWSDVTDVADAVATVNASGHASLAEQKDGSIVMTLDATSATSTAAGSDGLEAISVPVPAQSFTWEVEGASSCERPN